MVREFVPVRVETNTKRTKRETWFIDVTNLSVEQLSKLKKELIGKVDVSYIDDIISRRFCSESFYNRIARKDAGFKRRKSRRDKFRGK